MTLKPANSNYHLCDNSIVSLLGEKLRLYSWLKHSILSAKTSKTTTAQPQLFQIEHKPLLSSLTIHSTYYSILSSLPLMHPPRSLPCHEINTTFVHGISHPHLGTFSAGRFRLRKRQEICVASLARGLRVHADVTLWYGPSKRCLVLTCKPEGE